MGFIRLSTGSTSSLVYSGPRSARAARLTRRVASVFFLQMRGIPQQQRGQVYSGRICKDRAAVTGLHQHRKPAGVVEVRMRKHHIIKCLRDRSLKAGNSVPSARADLEIFRNR